MSDAVYIVERGTLFATDLQGNHRALSQDWGEVQSMAFSEGRIWAIQQATVFRIDPETGTEEVHSRGWGSGTKRLAASRGTVLLIDGRGRLFSLDGQGGFRYLSDGWGGTTAFCATAGRFFAVDEGRLFEVFPGTGGNRFVSDGWGDISAAAGLGGKVYLVSPRAGNLFEVRPDDNQETVISRDWFSTHLMLPLQDCLVLLDGRVLFEVGLDGSVRQISADWGATQGGTAEGD